MLEALCRKFKGGLPFKLLYADDLALMVETKELLLERLIKWKAEQDEKGPRVNLGKT